jgi:hypothetical protein
MVLIADNRKFCAQKGTTSRFLLVVLFGIFFVEDPNAKFSIAGEE